MRSFGFEKSQKNELFLEIHPKTCFLSADTYSDHESTLCEIIAFFRTRQTLCKTKFQKKLLLGGIFPDVFFIMFPFPGYLFTLCFLGGPRRPVGRPKKRHFFGRRKFRPFVFSHETIRCFLAPALSLRRRIPYLSANRLEPRISRDQHIQTCHFKTTNVRIHPVVPKVYTHLISFGQMEMANASGNFGNALVGLRAWNDAIHDFRRNNFFGPKKTRFFFGRLKKCCFFGPRLPDDCPKKTWLCGWLAIWLAGWLSGWLAGWLSSWLAIWLTRWLRWLAGYLAIGFVAAWLVGY